MGKKKAHHFYFYSFYFKEDNSVYLGGSGSDYIRDAFKPVRERERIKKHLAVHHKRYKGNKEVRKRILRGWVPKIRLVKNWTLMTNDEAREFENRMIKSRIKKGMKVLNVQEKSGLFHPDARTKKKITGNTPEERKEYDRERNRRRRKKKAFQEQERKRGRKYRAKNKEYFQEYYQKNKEKIAKLAKEYYQKNKEKLAEYQKEYRAKLKAKKKK